MSSPRVVVLGSINADVVVRTGRHPAVGETVVGSDVTILPGGKGLNQAVAAARAGATTALIGCVGNDAWADVAVGFLATTDVDVAPVERVDGATGVAVVTVAQGGENTIVVVPGANRAEALADAAARVIASLGPDDVLVAQLEVPVSTVSETMALARTRGVTTVLNASPASEVSPACLDAAAVVIVNEGEAHALDLPAVRRDGQVVVITRGSGPVSVIGPQGMHEIATIVADAVDTTGAGDCFAGVVAAGLAGALTMDAAIGRAMVAASLQVMRPGAAPAMPTRREIDTASSAGG